MDYLLKVTNLIHNNDYRDITAIIAHHYNLRGEV